MAYQGVYTDELVPISLRIGALTPIVGVSRATQTLTPVSVAASTTAEQVFTVLGLAVGDHVSLTAPAAQTAGTGIVGARVSAANTMAVTFINTTIGILTPASGSYIITVTR